MENGIFITFEGLDRVGKSTQINELVKYLDKKKFKYVLIREPGSTKISEKIRKILKDPSNIGKISPMTEFLLYSAARAQLVEDVIKPSLEKNKIVICDRFYDSSTAYQAYGRGLDIDFVKSTNNLVSGEIIPDLTILLTIELSSKKYVKNSKRFEPDLFDDRLEKEFMEFREKVQEGYLKIVKNEKERFLVIDASQSIKQIAKQVSSRIDSLLKLKGKP